MLAKVSAPMSGDRGLADDDYEIPPVVDALLRLVCWGFAPLAVLVLIGLWMHNLWPALWLMSGLGALLWAAIVTDKFSQRRKRRLRA